MGTMDDVSQALIALYTNPNPTAKEKANEYLQAFQKTDEAWATANAILQSPAASLESRVFAAQTFRAKINFDLDSLDVSLRDGLRNSLLSAITLFATGSAKVILVQLCIALADLALQLPGWASLVPDMIERFGKNPATVLTLLHFLTALPQEVVGNNRIKITNDDWRSDEVSTEVITTMSMYLGAEGVTDAIKNEVFTCVGAWLRAGELSVDDVSASPILDFLITSLNTDALFDTAVDALCDLIHETQDVNDCMTAIGRIVPRLIALKPLLTQHSDDPDRLRGYCRIFVEAGEWYAPLIVQHTETFIPIVEAIAICCASEDLEIAGITFHFWYRLAPLLRKHRESPAAQPLLEVFANLVKIVIRHLHYPDDAEKLVGQDGEDFRRFRHDAGDTLKDCCYVLGAEVCIQQSYDMILTAVSAGTPRWQDIEAPLFSMRTMGAEVDPQSNLMLPLITDTIPKLPQHPKIRYATILVLCRYTEWTDWHPDTIPFQLQYISSGFDDAADEVKLAAAQAMKYLCRDCSRHLVSYLSQLHQFVTTVGPTLERQDINEVSAAIGYIIATMPSTEAAQALLLFCTPLVESINNMVTMTSNATKKQLDQVSDELERIDTFLNIVGRLDSPLSEDCAKTVLEIWSVFDKLLERYGTAPQIAERSSAVIRRGLQFFDTAIEPILVPLVNRMTEAFDAGGASSYVWITSKVAALGADTNVPGLPAALQQAFERHSAKVFSLLQVQQASAIPDVIDDYVHLLAAYCQFAPEMLFLSPSFQTSFRVTLASLTLLAPEPLLASLDFIREVVGHESLDPNAGNVGAGLAGSTSFIAFGASIKTTLQSQGSQLCQLLFEGLLTDFPEDAVSTVVTIFRLLAMILPAEVANWVPAIAEALPNRAASPADRGRFVADFNAAMSQGRTDLVRNTFMNLYKASRREKQRQRARFDDR